MAGTISGCLEHTEPSGRISEWHVKTVSGIAESVETPKDSGLTATLEGNSVKISAAKDAKAGRIWSGSRDTKGKQATLNVSVKQ